MNQGRCGMKGRCATSERRYGRCGMSEKRCGTRQGRHAMAETV